MKIGKLTYFIGVPYPSFMCLIVLFMNDVTCEKFQYQKQALPSLFTIITIITARGSAKHAVELRWLLSSKEAPLTRHYTFMEYI